MHGVADEAAYHALMDLATSLGFSTEPSVESVGRETEPTHLRLAVLAERAACAAEWLAHDNVARARKVDGVTWEEVGRAFGITRQAAHERFSQNSRQEKTARRPRRRSAAP